MKYFGGVVLFLTVMIFFTTPSHTATTKVTHEKKHVNYTKIIHSWARYNFVSDDVSFRVISVIPYTDSSDIKAPNKLRLLTWVEYGEILFAYLLFVSPERGVERATLLGTDLFNKLSEREYSNPPLPEEQEEVEI